MIKPSITDQKKATLIMINQGSNYEHKVVENTGRAKTEEGAKYNMEQQNQRRHQQQQQQRLSNQNN
jgi:hypothetical protein